MTVAISTDLSNEEYHADPAISRSGIMTFDHCPLHYQALYITKNGPVKESTPAMNFGSAFHMFVLEPHLFDEHFAIEPTKVFLKDVGREAYEGYKAFRQQLDLDKKIIISRNEFYLLTSMRRALENHSQAWELINGGIYENSFFWQDKESGLDVKCRPDILHNSMIVDLKTCASASSKAYQRAMIDGGYHVQGAMMIDGIQTVLGSYRPNVINICIEKHYPYAIGIKVISEDAIKAGREKYKAVLMRMKKAFETKEFPAYEVEHVDLPVWAT